MAYPYPGGGGYPPVSRIALQATGHAGRLAGAIRDLRSPDDGQAM